MFLKSFNDYKNDDHPYLNRRAKLRENGFFLIKMIFLILPMKIL